MDFNLNSADMHGQGASNRELSNITSATEGQGAIHGIAMHLQLAVLVK